MLRTSVAALAALLLWSVPAFAEKMVRLSSGDELKVFGVSKVVALDGSSWNLRYETHHDPKQQQLQIVREVLLLWQDFAKPRVQRNNWEYFIICADTPKKDGVSFMMCHHFKLESGEWRFKRPDHDWQDLPAPEAIKISKGAP